MYCKQCGKRFEAYRTGSKYCTSECRKRAQNQRYAPKRKQQSRAVFEVMAKAGALAYDAYYKRLAMLKIKDGMYVTLVRIDGTVWITVNAREYGMIDVGAHADEKVALAALENFIASSVTHLYYTRVEDVR